LSSVFDYTGCGLGLQLISEKRILWKLGNGFDETSLRKGVNTEVGVEFLRKVLQLAY
jgi:hypothetical protein